MGLGGTMLAGIPIIGHAIPLDQPWTPGDVAAKKQWADVALNAAKSKGASYTDVRIGRYLRQFVVTREDKVQNIVNTESYGMGMRVLANGSWGFAATDKLDTRQHCENGCNWPCNCQRKCKAAHRAGATGSAKRLWRSELESAHRKKCL